VEVSTSPASLGLRQGSPPSGILIDGTEIIDAGLVLSAGDELVAFLPRADRSRAAYLPGVTRARVWCAGPAIDRANEALVGAPTSG
jgi:hypothetical protein